MQPNDAAPLVFGLVMAGGHSSRMGADKAALELHGVPQGRYCFELLRKKLGRVWMSVRPDVPRGDVLAGLDCIDDAHGDIGPMSGVLSAIDQEPDAAWLVLACDLPFVTARTIEGLLEARDPGRMATAFMASDGFFEPLLAIYEPSIAPHLRQRLGAGRYSLRKALADADVQMVCASDDRLLTNINTPKDLADARALLAAGKAGL